MFFLSSVSNSHSLTSSLSALADRFTVVISCSAISWFWNNVCIALCLLSFIISRLQGSLEPRLERGRIWCLLYFSCLSFDAILVMIYITILQNKNDWITRNNTTNTTHSLTLISIYLWLNLIQHPLYLEKPLQFFF